MTKKSKKSVALRTLYYFWSAQWRHKGLTLTAFISTPIVVLWRDVISVYLITDIIAKITENPSSEYIFSNLVPEAVLIIVLRLIFSVIVGELRVWCHWRMEIFAMYYLSNLCFDTVAAQSMQFHNDRFSGSLVSQVNKFVSAYERFMDSLNWNIIPLMTTIVSALSILFLNIPLFATGLLIFVILYIIIAYLSFRKIIPLNLKVANSENKRTGQLADSISNIISVKSYANEHYEHKRYKDYSEKVASATSNLLSTEIKRNLGFDMVYAGIGAITLIFLLSGQGVFGISIAVLLLVFQYTTTITNYLWNFNSFFKDMNRVFGDASEMTEILDMEDSVVDAPDATNLEITSASVDFNNISFRHQGAKADIFEDFSLKINPGERIGLVGVSGSGKTTLTKLLLRFADVRKGEILIDNQNIHNVTQESLRKNIAYVPQETSLFHRSIAENIAYAKPGASKVEIERVSKLANVDEFVRQLPDGYKTLVGERGVKLSGGQRQRIAIARAILKDAPILVLDEATSALDSESEALIQEALTHLMKNRTAIVIAHRLSTVAHLDRIVVLSNGKIVEQGTHSELLEKNGAYSRLWKRQSGGFIE